MIDSHVADELSADEILRLAPHIPNEYAVPRAIVEKVLQSFSGGLSVKSGLEVRKCRKIGGEFKVNNDGEEIHGYALFSEGAVLLYAPCSSDPIEIFGLERDRINAAAAVVRMAGRNYSLMDVK